MGGDLVEFFFVGVGEGVDGLDRDGAALLDEIDNSAGEGFRACSAAGEGFSESAADALFVAEGAELVELFRRVVGEAIDGDDGGNAEAAEVLDVAGEVGGTTDERVPFVVAFALALVAEALDGGDEDGRRRADSGNEGDDIEVLLGAEVSGKSALVDDVVGQAEAHELGDDGAGAMGDVAKGTRMNKSGRALGGLNEIGQDGVGEESHHCAGGAEVGGGDRFAGARCADDDGAETAAEIGAVAGEGENGHNLRCGGDDEAGAAGGSLAFAVDVDGDAAEGAIVHVHGAGPPNLVGVDVQVVAVEEVGIDQRCEKIVRGGDGVEVAGEVEINLLAGLDPGEPSASRTPLHAEDGAEGGLAGGDDGAFADAFESLDEADGGDGLAFPGCGGSGGGDEDELAVGRPRRILQDVEVELGRPGGQRLVFAVGEAQFAGDGGNGQQAVGVGRFCEGGHRIFSQRLG